MVSKVLLSELKEIMKENYGIEMPDESIFELANSLLQFGEVLLRVSSEGGKT